MKYFRSFLRVVLGLFFYFNAGAQVLEQNFDNAFIKRLPKGFVVYGGNDNTIKVHFYDESVQLLKKIEKNLGEDSDGIPYRSELNKDSSTLELSTLTSTILIDLQSFEISSNINVPHKERMNQYGREEMDRYIPYSTASQYYFRNINNLEFGGNYIEILQNKSFKGGVVTVIGSRARKYKGQTEIRSFKPNNDELGSYSLHWKIALDHETIMDLEWLKFNDDTYLLVTDIFKEKIRTILYKIDLEVGKILKKIEFTGIGNQELFISKITQDQEGELLINGYTFINNDSANWFIQKCSRELELGKIRRYDINNHQTNIGQAKLMSIMQGVRYIKQKEDGGIQLFFENIRIITPPYQPTIGGNINNNYGPGIYDSYGVHLSAVTGGVSQTYGYTYVELDKELELLKTQFYPRFSADDDRSTYRGDPSTLIPGSANFITVLKGYESLYPINLNGYEYHTVERVKPISDNRLLLICILQNPINGKHVYRHVIINDHDQEKDKCISTTDTYVVATNFREETTKSFLLNNSELLIFKKPVSGKSYQLVKYPLE